MARLAERSGMPVQLPVARQNLLGMAVMGNPNERVQALDLMATLVTQLTNKPLTPPAAAVPGDEPAADPTPQILSELREGLRKGTFDPDENVRAWAVFLNGLIAPAEQQAATVQRLSGGTHWQERLLAGVLVQATRQGAPALEPLAESDADPVVKAYATHLLDRLTAPTTAPATAPATQP